MLDVVALGELLIDFAPVSTDGDGYPTMAAHPGGAPANFLAALTKYGMKTALLGKVGDDAFGKLLVGTLEKAGIETSGIIADPDTFTTLAFVTLDEKGDREFSFARKPGADTQIHFEELNLNLIDEAKVFHFGTLSLTDEPARSTTYQTIAYAKSKGKLITYDPNLRKPLWRTMEEAKKQILWGLNQADVVKISDEEVEFLWNCTPEEGADKLLSEFGVRLAMVTLGPKGAYLKNKNGSCYVTCPKVSPVDTTGAGDIFGGSAVSRILALGVAPDELTVEQMRSIGSFASTAASLSTEKHGGIPSIPEENTVRKRCNSEERVGNPMMIRQNVLNFEKLGLGMFVHFGLYSVIGKGEWARHILQIPPETYDETRKQFYPKEDWAQELVRLAKQAGCRYITMTTRHHDGYSLYDTCGLNEYNTVCDFGRDLVREFVDACRQADIIPFFYHTLLDWHEPCYKTDFQAYLRYLRGSVELLCRNYGTIGGFWFDGMWDKPHADWQEDALYGMIRSLQPDAVLINNTGLGARGQLGHIELDSVTFERGKPQPINLKDSPKYIASEMCEVTCSHWGYAREDLNFKAPAQIIEELCDCRRSGANFLLNVGLMGDGSIQLIDRATMEILGQWMQRFGEAIYSPRPSGIAVHGRSRDMLLKGKDAYYLFCFGLGMSADQNVALNDGEQTTDHFVLPDEISRAVWMDNGETVPFSQKNGEVTIEPKPFTYGTDLVVRVAKLSI